MTFIASFADESGTHKNSPCYTIGILNVPENYLSMFNQAINEMYLDSGLQGEIKWEKIRKSSGQVNLCTNILKFVLQSPCTFHSIAVYKAPYRKWHSNEEAAFFTTYDYLLRQSSHGLNSKFKVYIDQKSSSYPKQDEVMQIITNHMLSKLPTSSTIEHVSMENSKLHWGLQAVDILTGAINTGYHLYFDENAQVQKAKRVSVSRMANILGWDKLHYDTYPNDHFNIWHFPQETTGLPATRNVNPNFMIGNISREEFESTLF